MVTNSNSSNQWPFKNFAMNLRATQAANFFGRAAAVIPRLKYAFVIDFQINPAVLQPNATITNFHSFLRNGRIFTPLKSVDFPSTNFEVVTLRSYNSIKKIPVKMEHPSSTIVFHDDAASIAMSLWKEYVDFYHHTGDIGINTVAQRNLSSVHENNSYWLGGEMTGHDVRSEMDYRPSVGMKLRTNDTKYFFETITIYDLGSEPDSVNIHHYYHPVVTSFSHDNYDVEDASSKQTFTLTFEPESTYSVLGQSRNQIKDILYTMLGEVPEGNTTPSTGHTIMTMPERKLSNRVVPDPTIDENGIIWDTPRPDGSVINNGVSWGIQESDTQTTERITSSVQDALNRTTEQFGVPNILSTSPTIGNSNNIAVARQMQIERDSYTRTIEQNNSTITNLRHQINAKGTNMTSDQYDRHVQTIKNLEAHNKLMQSQLKKLG